VVTQRTDTLSTGVDPDIAGYRWLFEGSEIPGATSFEYIASDKGAYTVEITDTNGCRAVSEPFIYGDFGTARSTISVIPRSIEGAAGDIVTIPIVLESAINLAPAGAGAFVATLRFDRTMLWPLEGNASVDGNDRIVVVGGRLVSGSDTLALVPCAVLLGNAERTAITIDSFEWISASVEVVRRDGEFILNGICRTGTSRLVESTSALKIAIRPNPTGTRAEASIDLTEDGTTRIDLVDGSGRLVARVFDGEMKHGNMLLPIEVDGLESGSYYLVVRTPSDVAVERLMIRK
jgi:hypothetical protein